MTKTKGTIAADIACRSPGESGGASVAERLQPLLDPDHLLARATGARGGFLGGLYLAPVGEIGGLDRALGQPALEAFGAGAVAAAAGRHCSRDRLGDLIAVGAVGADGSGRAA